MNIEKHLFFYCLYLCLFIAIWFIYQSGISNQFILDDIINLSDLAKIKASPDIQQYSLFLFQDNFKRVLSLLSFVFQADSWPYAKEFKQLNILLHLINGLLVFFITHQLLTLIKTNIKKQYYKWLALIVSAIFLLSPIQVTTVLYTIQRMAMLSALFMFLAIISYLLILQSHQKHRTRYLSGLYLAFGIFLTLAVFSKENAILLCLYIPFIGAFINSPIKATKSYKIWSIIMLYLPLMLFAAYLLNLYFNGYFEFRGRSFNLPERFLTELRIIVQYLVKIIVPTPHSFTLFYENYPISTSLFNPLTTLTSLIFIVTLNVLAVKVRKTHPLFSLGIGLYFMSHLIESTIFPLELYFEHRNYFGLFAIALAISSLVIQLKEKYLKVSVSVVLIWLIMLSYITFTQTQLWANPLQQAYRWYIKNPTSHRAHGHYAKTLLEYQRVDDTVLLYQQTIHLFKDDPTKPLLWWELQCYKKIDSLPDKNQLLNIAEKGEYHNETLAVLLSIVSKREQGQCQSMDDQLLLKIILKLQKNQNYAHQIDEMDILIARIFQLHNNYVQAAKYLESALKRTPQKIDIKLSLAEKYLLLNKLPKAQSIIKSLEQQCSRISLKCLKHEDDFNSLKNLYNKRVEQLSDKNPIRTD